jgi:hypothetical protein
MTAVRRSGPSFAALAMATDIILIDAAQFDPLDNPLFSLKFVRLRGRRRRDRDGFGGDRRRRSAAPVNVASRAVGSAAAHSPGLDFETGLTFGAICVASAVFFMLELGLPYTGLFRVSPAALQEAIPNVDKLRDTPYRFGQGRSSLRERAALGARSLTTYGLGEENRTCLAQLSRSVARAPNDRNPPMSAGNDLRRDVRFGRWQ